MMVHRISRLALGLSLITSLFTSAPAAAESQRLVVEDQIRLRVVEWRSADGRYASWEALEGVYTINEAGEIAVPVIGTVPASGKTTQELAETLAVTLAERAGLPTPPSVAIEVEEHAPIFVVGSVQSPGRYPFQAGMTTMKAVSVAGGFLRSRGDNAYLLRDQIQAAGAYRTAVVGQRELLLRRARLTAEIEGRDDFDIPAELVGAANIEAAKADELNLLQLRRVQLSSRIAAADDLVTLYGQEIQSLDAKIKSQKQQIDRARKELETATSLVTKGAITNSRQLAIDRDLATLQSNLLDLEIALTRARQAVSESDREKANLVYQRNAENQQELNTIDAALSRASIEMQVAQLLGQQAGYNEQLAQLEAAADETRSEQRTYRIIRRNADGSTTVIPGDEATLLVPHDLVEIGISTSRAGAQGIGKSTSLMPAGNNAKIALDTTAAGILPPGTLQVGP
ncbi:polysaccharide biosynthesis/export family protein [Rhizobium sp. AAP43]|uniref:polysaccharide biosynthesis/export family protein n=1 Tax=Rhizobium sp. AAP43 TaxID=1523420 RepID=UPI0009E6D474|nr:polysaccharide biosynthesis/export family protein [Rhizobium sp. AAP43]